MTVWFSALLFLPASAIAQCPPVVNPQLAQQIDDRFAALSSHILGALVESEDGARTYYCRIPDNTRRAASVTKSFVVAASIETLGLDHRFITRVLANGTIDDAGVLQGDLNLLGNHDFTWHTDFYASNSRFPLDQLAQRLYAGGLRAVTGTVRGYGELVYENVVSRPQATEAFRDALLAAGISAGPTATSSSFNAPGVVLEEWRSVPLAQACRPLLKHSRNGFAETLLRHLAYQVTGSNSVSVGETLVKNFLAARGVDPTGIVINDGAGFNTRFTPRQCVGVSRIMMQTPNGYDFNAMLPIGGVDGTLSSRYTSGPGFGRVHAKTGTLTGVITLSGYIVNPFDNQRYFFAFMLNDTTSTHAQSRAAIDDAVALLAGNINGLAGSVPAAAVLRSVIGLADGQTAQVNWSPAAGAQVYRIYRSDTGFVWTLHSQVGSQVHTLLVSGLPEGQVQHFMVRAANTHGESQDSNACSVRVGTRPGRVLLVSGNERWPTQPENREGLNHEFLVRFSEVMPPDIPFDSSDNKAVEDGAISLSAYPAVLWMLGEESTAHQTFSSTEQALVSAYLDAGGNIFVSGAEIGWDLVARGSASDRAFYNNYLKAAYIADSAETQIFRPAGGIFSGLDPDLISFHATWMIIGFPDVIAPFGGSTANLEYIATNSSSAGMAGIQYDGPFRVVNLGFPFESIAHRPTRSAMMEAILDFLLEHHVELRADFDFDGDVDQEDFAFLQRCLSGSFVPHPTGCAAADLDGDGDVDQDDVLLFLQCKSGPNIPADPHCIP